MNFFKHFLMLILCYTINFYSDQMIEMKHDDGMPLTMIIKIADGKTIHKNSFCPVLTYTNLAVNDSTAQIEKDDQAQEWAFYANKTIHYWRHFKRLHPLNWNKYLALFGRWKSTNRSP